MAVSSPEGRLSSLSFTSRGVNSDRFHVTCSSEGIQKNETSIWEYDSMQSVLGEGSRTEQIIRSVTWVSFLTVCYMSILIKGSMYA